MPIVASACSGEPLDSAPVDDTPVSVGSEVLLASVEDAHGGSVEWVTTPDEDGVEVRITAKFPHSVLVSPDFVEAHGPLLTYQILRPDAPEIPTPLLHAVAPEEVERLRDPQQVEKARTAYDAERSTIGTKVAALDVDTTSSGLGAGCSTSFRTWVRSAYGRGYGTSYTCGDPNLLQWPGLVSKDYFYCSGSSCDESLGAQDAYTCSPSLGSCAAVRGRLFSRVARGYERTGRPFFSSWGHRYRFGVANCSGNGAVRARRRAAGGSTKTDSIGVGYMTIRVGFAGTLSGRVVAINNVSYGLWRSGISTSSSTYKEYSFWVDDNNASNDRVIMCVDHQTEIQMSDISSCGNRSLCSGSGCSGNCWN